MKLIKNKNNNKGLKTIDKSNKGHTFLQVSLQTQENQELQFGPAGEIYYSWILMTWKRFELSGFELSRVKLVWKWPERKSKQVQVHGRFELPIFNCKYIYLIINFSLNYYIKYFVLTSKCRPVYCRHVWTIFVIYSYFYEDI